VLIERRDRPGRSLWKAAAGRIRASIGDDVGKRPKRKPNRRLVAGPQDRPDAMPFGERTGNGNPVRSAAFDEEDALPIRLDLADRPIHAKAISFSPAGCGYGTTLLN